jgi:4a-hydroxytetrahydrobiopterin dehydratase
MALEPSRPAGLAPLALPRRARAGDARPLAAGYRLGMDWTQKKCVPCEGGVPKLPAARASELLSTLDGWDLHEERLHHHFRFRDFASAMRFVNAVAELAEREGHHPDFSVHDWNLVDVTIWTHAIGGLSENDFILAGKIDALTRDAPPEAKR